MEGDCRQIVLDNIDLAQNHWPGSEWFAGKYISLPWRLCLENMAGQKPEEITNEVLIEALTEPSSEFRVWSMQLAWMIRPLLSPPSVIPQMFKNIADTLGGVRYAVGLASAFCSSNDEMLKLAEEYKPPANFEQQFKDRIQACNKEGFALSQCPMLDIERDIRKLIQDQVFASSAEFVG